MQNATDEGFRFNDGIKPTRRKWHDIIAIYRDKSICYVGLVGHLYSEIAKCDVPRINYECYINYEEDYYYHEKQLNTLNEIEPLYNIK